MRFVFIAMIILMLTPTYAQESKGLSGCYEDAFTQKDLNTCSRTDYKAADTELNRVYKKIQQVYKDDPLFLNKLKIAQLTWIKYRDASFDMKYPKNDERSYYGSVFPMCSGIYLTEITIIRIAQLKIWLKGIEEGDVCVGSVKRPDQIKILQNTN